MTSPRDLHRHKLTLICVDYSLYLFQVCSSNDSECSISIMSRMQCLTEDKVMDRHGYLHGTKNVLAALAMRRVCRRAYGLVSIRILPLAVVLISDPASAILDCGISEYKHT